MAQTAFQEDSPPCGCHSSQCSWLVRRPNNCNECNILRIAFLGLGAPFSWAETIVLSAITVLMSLISFVPNGLGISDVLWVLVAEQSGLSLEASVSLAILLEFGHLIGITVTFFVLRLALGSPISQPSHAE